MDRNKDESSTPPFAQKGMSIIEPHCTSSSCKHSLGEKWCPRNNKVHYEDTDQSSDLSDTEQSDNSKTDYVPSDHTSTSSVVGSRHLATITKDVRGCDLTTVHWPWSDHTLQCIYESLAQPDCDPTDTMFASVSVAANPKVLRQTNHCILNLLSSFAA